ncbi:MFS general substrate transporter [Marasmius fiardii PR-910]|nr:MFS general substrate transporter [Marasmius fiardii PR-910]
MATNDDHVSPNQEPPSSLPSETPTRAASTEPPNHGPSVSKEALQLTDQTNLLPFKQVVFVFLGLSVCVVVSAFDSVIVATALSTISSTFHAGSVISWVPSAYLLTSTAFQPLYGRMSDIFGRKSAICTAMAVFMLGNLIAGFSNSIIQLIVFRGVAGAGGGGIISMMQIIISDIITLRERGKYQGIIGIVVALGYTVGPVLGGALVQKASWRWCFWITIPLSVVATCIVVFVLPLKPVEGDFRRKLLAVDYLGALLTLASSAMILLPLIWGGVTFPWNSAIVLAPLCAGIFGVVLFCLWEWKGARLPIVPMYIFKHSTVCGVYITMFVNGFCFFSQLYYLPQFFQVVSGYSALHAGLFLIPVLICQMAASWISGLLVSRTGRYQSIVNSGFALLAISSGCISTLKATTPKAVQVVLMMLAGCGGGMTLQTTTVAVQASVARKDMSVVTAFRNFMRNVGGALSLAVASSLINNTLRISMKALSFPQSTITDIINDPSVLFPLAHPTTNTTTVVPTAVTQQDAQYILTHGYNGGFRNIFILNGSLAAMATIVSVLMIKHKELVRAEDAEMMKARKVLETRDKQRGYDEERGRVGGIDIMPVAGAAPVLGGHELEVLPRRSEEVKANNEV